MIRPDTIYTLAELEQRGISENALRVARRRGLPVHRLGRALFIHGADLIAFLKQQGGQQDEPGST